MLFSALATFIAYGALLGYKKIAKSVDKSTPIIIIAVSLIIILITTLIIIPLCLLYKEGYIVNFDNLKIIYSIKDFKNAIFKDLIVSLIFTIIGISGIISKIKQEVNPSYELSKENSDIECVKAAFKKYDAMNKYKTTSKENILILINNNNALFNKLVIQQIIRKYRGNYYFCEKSENNLMYRFSLIYVKIILFVIIIFIVFLLLFSFIN